MKVLLVDPVSVEVKAEAKWEKGHWDFKSENKEVRELWEQKDPLYSGACREETTGHDSVYWGKVHLDQIADRLGLDSLVADWTGWEDVAQEIERIRKECEPPEGAIP
ncbi:MAG: hypothetical protein ACXQTM_05585 [Methanosarcinales archaeon]